MIRTLIKNFVVSTTIARYSDEIKIEEHLQEDFARKILNAKLQEMKAPFDFDGLIDYVVEHRKLPPFAKSLVDNAKKPKKDCS